MRLVTFDADGESQGGVLVGDCVVDLSRAAGRPEPLGVRAFLAEGLDHRQVTDAAAALVARGEGRHLKEVHLLAPVPDPDKILCIGLNYRDHAEEAGLDLPREPMVFAKFRNSLIGPNDPVVLPNVPDRIDYEAELAVVIGRRGKEIPESQAWQYIAGVTAFNDISARDMQKATSQWTMGKAIDTFGPCGPALVTTAEIGDVADLWLRTRVNGRLVQDGTTAQMVFSVPQLVAHLSRAMTLEPGDIIATGTPAGVGFTRRPPVLLGHGDLVEVEIEGIGRLANRVTSASGTSVTDEATTTAVPV